MSNEGIQVIFWTLIVLAIGQLLLAFLKKRKGSELKRMARVQETQNQFALARKKLIQHACEGKIDPNEEAFRFLYQTNTMFMRRPDQYEQLSRVVQEGAIAGTKEHRSKKAEKASAKNKMSDELREVYQLTGEAIGHIAIEHSKFLRFFLGGITKSLKSLDKNRGHSYVFGKLIKSYLEEEEKRMKADENKEKLEDYFRERGGMGSVKPALD